MSNPDRYLLESSTTDGYLLEDGSGVLLLDFSFYRSIILADSPLAYWRLGETGGEKAYDEMGTFHATLSTVGSGLTLGQTGALSGDPNTAILLNPALASDITVVANGTSLDLGDGPLSIEAWVKKTNNGVNYGILSRGVGSYYLRISSSNDLNFLRSNTVDIVHSTNTWTDTTTWHHVVATKNGAAVKLYFDGDDVTGTVTNSTLANPSELLFIGSDTNSNETIDGQLDEVAVYGSVLTLAQVRTHYRAGLPAMVPYINPMPALIAQ